MAEVNLTINNEMKEEFLNDWKNGDVYLVVASGQNVIGSKKIVFNDATSQVYTSKIEWIPSGTSTDNNGSDFEIPVGTTISNISLLDTNTTATTATTYASAPVTEEFTYGGIVRVDKATITLT